MVMGPDINYNFNFNFTYSRAAAKWLRVAESRDGPSAMEHDEYRSLHIRMSNYLNMYKNYLQAM